MVTTASSFGVKGDPGGLPRFGSILPLTIRGWNRTKEAEIYRPDNLYEYINGGAELFISYRFRSLEAWEYRRGGEIEIPVDIFDMGHPHNAFGVFRHGCEERDTFVGRGVESQYSGGLLTFWKGPYYVSILAYPENEAKRRLVRDLARKISAAIAEENRIPPLVHRLPRRQLRENSVRYFTSYIWLNSHYTFADDNLLNIGERAPAVLAKYRLGRDPRQYTVLLVVEYVEPAPARQALRTFRKHFGIPKTGPIRLKDHRWTAARRRGNRLAVVFGAPDAASARGLLNRTERKGAQTREEE